MYKPLLIEYFQFKQQKYEEFGKEYTSNLYSIRLSYIILQQIEYIHSHIFNNKK
jgi:hypothetical protein